MSDRSTLARSSRLSAPRSLRPNRRVGARRLGAVIEGLEIRRLLASETFGDVSTTTASAVFLNGALSAPAVAELGANALDTGDDWRFINAAFNEALTVPQFNTMGGTRVLTEVQITGNLDVLQDFNFRVINNNGVDITFTADGTANASFVNAGSGLNLGANVAVPVPLTTIPGTPGLNDVTTVDHDFDGDAGLITLHSGDVGFAGFIGAGNVAFQLAGSATTQINFNGLGNEVVSGGYTTIGRADVSVTYIFGVPQARISIAPNDVNAVGDPHTFTALVEQDDGLAIGEFGGDAFNGFGPAQGALVDFNLDGQNGAIPDVSAPVNLAPADPSIVNDVATNAAGNAAVTFTSATAGLVVGSASADLTILGAPVNVTTNGAGGNSGPATKRFVDARINISPDDVNAVGDPHTFIITVTQDDGLTAAQGGDGVTGFAPIAGALVDVALDGQNGAVPDVSAPVNLAPADPSTLLDLVTNASGQVSVTFTSAIAGLVVGSASADLTVGGVPLTRSTNGASGNSDPAVKRFVDARIEIDPDGTNPVNDPHTFIISVFQNDGLSAAQGGDGVSGFTAVGAGVPVEMTLTNGGGAVANPAGPFIGVTDALGQFSMTFTSATAGTVTGHGATEVSFARLPSEQPPATPIVVQRETNGAETTVGSGVFNSDDAIKTFVDQPPPPAGEGLTPGFWKNHTALWVGLSPNQTVASVFGPVTHLYGIGNATLLQALSFSSGTLGSGQLVRHAIAGILNANHPLVDYPLTAPEIVAGVQVALFSFNRNVIQFVKDALEDNNELGGGIDAHGNPI